MTIVAESHLDYIYKYEDLQNEFAHILATLGIEQERPLPQVNRTQSKKDYLEYSRSPLEIELMRQIRKAFDPQGIMNPGKIFD